MNLKLIKAESIYKDKIIDMLDEWHKSGEVIIPSPIAGKDYHDFENYCSQLEVVDALAGKVPDSTYFCIDTDRDIIVGDVNIRHYLNESLIITGGHIGDGIRPSERRKGYATEMIRLALIECRKLGIDRVLMTCDKDNIGSAKSIINNGGILENELIKDGVIKQRYWIENN